VEDNGPIKAQQTPCIRVSSVLTRSHRASRAAGTGHEAGGGEEEGGEGGCPAGG